MPAEHPELSVPAPAVTSEAARLEAFVACTADAVIAFDPEGWMTHWNPAAERMFGYTAEEAIGQSYTLIGTSEVYDFQHRIFSETIRGDTHKWYDTRRRCKNGSLLDVSITTSPLIINGKIEGLVAIVRDISEKVRIAQELQKRNAELDSTARQMAELNAQLHAVAEEKRRFVNMVIHDLRHPLTTMRTVLYLLRGTEQIEEREEYLDVVDGRVSALISLLNELTEYHRIEAGHTHLQIEPVDMRELVRECIDNFTPALVGGQVQIVDDLDDVPDIIPTDPVKITHILLNLLSNALKYTPRGTITVSAGRAGGHHWFLKVSDTGAGMRPEVQSRVYDEFFQGEVAVAPRRQEGTGLGLSIVRKFSETLHGEIELTSVPGSGTSFRLLFPYRLDAGGSTATDDKA